MAGRRSDADKLLQQIDDLRDRDFWWGDHDDAELLVASLLRGFVVNRKALDADLEEIVTHHKFKYAQKLWYDAAFLLGRISAKTHAQQPSQPDISVRTAFIRAVAADLKNDRREACRGYGSLTKTFQPYPDHSLLRVRFAEWRLKELEA